MRNLVLAAQFLLVYIHGLLADNNPYYHKEILDKDGHYQLEWLVDLQKSEIYFNVTAKTQGYVGLGLSRKGKMSGADIAIGGVLSSGLPYFSDRHAVGNQLPIEDLSQDWVLHEAWEKSGTTFLSFSRTLETCDEDHDLPIHGDVIAVLWAFGEKDDEVEYHFQNRGVYWAYLLDPDLTPRELKGEENPGLDNFGNWDIWRIPGGQVIPAKDTTYMCSIYKTPVATKEHVVGFRAILPTEIDKRHIHHFLLQRCVPPPDQNPDDLYGHLLNHQEECYILNNPSGLIQTQYCSEYIYVWGVGQKPTFFPENIGIPITPNEYILLQMHYDNPDSLRNIRVSYELEVFHTKDLRDHDAAILILGASVPSSPSIMIPPNSLEHEIYGHCAAECTQSILPSSGIRVFNVFLHTHTAGRGLRLIHMRGNSELPWIAYDNNYNFNFQQIRILPKERLILPGDRLYVRCIYENADRLGNVTVGGFSTRQEMCAGIIWYYNKIPDRAVCHSEIRNEEYNRFLRIFNTTWLDEEVEMIVTSPEENAGLLVSQVGDYRVNWNLEKRKRLQEYHRNLPQISQCPLSVEPSTNARPLRKRSLAEKKYFKASKNQNRNSNVAYEFASVYPRHVKPYERPRICQLAH